MRTKKRIQDNSYQTHKIISFYNKNIIISLNPLNNPRGRDPSSNFIGDETNTAVTCEVIHRVADPNRSSSVPLFFFCLNLLPNVLVSPSP